MEYKEDPNSKQALRIAICILRERCNTFQNRISDLEEENIKLKSELKSYHSNEGSIHETDSLKQRLASAEEQNTLLRQKVKIISKENLHLWTKLGKLSCANKSLGTHLSKMNDTLTQHANNHQPLIRSKTFTQDRPNTYDSPEKVNSKEEKLDLEEVSLKLMSNLTNVQNEVDSLTLLSEEFKNLAIFDNIMTSSLQLNSENNNDESNDFNEELNVILKEMEFARDESQRQNKMLRETLELLKSHKEKKLPAQKDEINDFRSKMCPMCSRQFPEEMAFSVFVNHVESHFKS